jgi:hypothetical protein
MSFLHFAIVAKVALGPTQSPIQWVPGALTPKIKRMGHEADHSRPTSSKVKNAWSYTSLLPVSLHSVVLSSAQGQLHLYLNNMQ